MITVMRNLRRTVWASTINNYYAIHNDIDALLESRSANLLQYMALPDLNRTNCIKRGETN